MVLVPVFSDYNAAIRSHDWDAVLEHIDTMVVMLGTGASAPWDWSWLLTVLPGEAPFPVQDAWWHLFECFRDAPRFEPHEEALCPTITPLPRVSI